jgi:hypothetical protein
MDTETELKLAQEKIRELQASLRDRDQRIMELEEELFQASH